MTRIEEARDEALKAADILTAGESSPLMNERKALALILRTQAVILSRLAWWESRP